MTLRALAIPSLLVALAACRTVGPPGPVDDPIPDGPLVLGRIDYRERELLPTPATLEVELVRVDPARKIETAVGRWERRDPGSVPITFWIPYDPEEVAPTATYVVRARIDGDAGRLWQTTKQFSVDLPAEVDRVLAARQAATPSEPAETGAEGGAEGGDAAAEPGSGEAAPERGDGADADVAGDMNSGEGHAEATPADPSQRDWLDIGRVVLTRVPRRRVEQTDASTVAAEPGAPDGQPGEGAVGAAGGVRPDGGRSATGPGRRASAPEPPPEPPVDPDPVVVRGRVFRRPGPLPAGSTLFVRLIERPADGSDDRIVRETSFDELPNAPVDFEFRLEVTDVDLASEHRITAEVLGPDGALLLRTTGRFEAAIPPEGGDVQAPQVLMREVPR